LALFGKIRFMGFGRQIPNFVYELFLPRMLHNKAFSPVVAILIYTCKCYIKVKLKLRLIRDYHINSNLIAMID
jgi:ABC-type phosphate/phosphonate transport system permease subunit